MPERWLAWCRRFVPEALRADGFDPTASDLMHEFYLRPAARNRASRAVAHLRLGLRLLWASGECRRLAVITSRHHNGSLPWTAFGKRTMFRDFVSTTRRLWREPRFAASVILTLAMGLGANLTVFTFVNAYLLAPLPVPEPGALLRVSEDRGAGNVDLTSFPNYRDGHDAAASVMGGAAGLGAGYLAAYQLRAWLFDVAPFDLVVTAGVIVTVALLATLSAWMPARRASRIDPVRALR
ncbi:MAG: hypothetical protein ABIP90_03320 [Vicinamibacterales bacterium]